MVKTTTTRQTIMTGFPKWENDAVDWYFNVTYSSTPGNSNTIIHSIKHWGKKHQSTLPARHTPSIVIELGSAFIKVRIASEAQSHCILPSCHSLSSLSSSHGDTDESDTLDTNIPAINFVKRSSLYSTIPFLLGSNIGIVVDVGCMEFRMGVYLNWELIHDTKHVVPIGIEMLKRIVIGNNILSLLKSNQSNDDNVLIEENTIVSST